VLADRQQLRRVTVAQVVKADIRQVGSLDRHLEVALKVAGLDGSAVGDGDN
jgi:hypothetical protein